jgi:hypothetical protein
VPVFGDPVRRPASVAALNEEALSLYQRAQQLDPWAGEAYEGTSVLAGVQAGQERGWWHEYRWALGPGPEAAAEDVILALGYAGPVILGTYWKSTMWAPDADGYLDTSGDDVGGHGYLLTAYSRRRDAVYTPNSWDGEGAGWIRRTGLVALLANDGEACIPLHRDRTSS